MLKIKGHPVRILSILSLFIIIAFMAVAASGFKGIMPGSMIFSNKSDNGFYVFHRFLKEMGYAVEFENRYTIPKKASSTIVYAAADKDQFSKEDYLSWLKKGNTLVLIGSSAALLLDDEVIESGESYVLRDSFNKTSYEGALSASDYFSGEKIKNIEGLRILYQTSNGAVIVESSVGSGQVLFISDPSLFNNENMHNLQNALLLEDIFSPMKGQPLYMREQSPEAVYDVSLIKGLLEGKGGYLFLQILILFILSILIMGKRFARPEKIEALERRKVTEHVKAVGLFFQKANACQLIESVDTDYFKTIICKSKKPSDLSSEEYAEYGSVKQNITEDDIVHRFKERQLLKSRIDKRR